MRLLPLVLVASLVAANTMAADDRISDGAAPVTEIRVGEQDTYGTGSLTVHTISSTNFTARNSGAAYLSSSNFERYSLGPLESGVMIPNGAQIERLELRACDADATLHVRASLFLCTIGACNVAGDVSTGGGATPGCADFSTTLAPPLIVNNQTASMVISIITGDLTATFSGVRLYYRLRVSPAPAVASFSDVPTTHGQFRFVEALAAAGITGGCGGGNFCPDAPLTRGQMAVFLSTALGLHFPN